MNPVGLIVRKDLRYSRALLAVFLVGLVSALTLAGRPDWSAGQPWLSALSAVVLFGSPLLILAMVSLPDGVYSPSRYLAARPIGLTTILLSKVLFAIGLIGAQSAVIFMSHRIVGLPVTDSLASTFWIVAPSTGIAAFVIGEVLSRPRVQLPLSAAILITCVSFLMIGMTLDRMGAASGPHVDALVETAYNRRLWVCLLTLVGGLGGLALSTRFQMAPIAGIAGVCALLALTLSNPPKLWKRPGGLPTTRSEATLITTETPSRSIESDHVVWSVFSLPRQQGRSTFFLPMGLEADVTGSFGTKTINSEDTLGSHLIWNAVPDDDWRAALRERYPNNVTWRFETRHFAGVHPVFNPSPEHLPGAIDAIGELDGYYCHYELVDSVPLQPGHKSGALRLTNVEISGTQASVVLLWTRPKAESRDSLLTPNRPSGASLRCVLYQEEAADAWEIETPHIYRRESGDLAADIYRLEFDIPLPRIPIAVLGQSPESWLRTARLDLFETAPLERARFSFLESSIRLSYPEQDGEQAPAESVTRQQAQGLMEELASTSIPLNERLQTLLENLDGVSEYTTRRGLIDGFLRSEPGAPSALIDTLPSGNHDDMIINRLHNLVSERDRPALIQALDRDTRAAILLNALGWDLESSRAAARQIRVEAPDEWRANQALILGALPLRDPELYAHIQRRLVRERFGHAPLLERLRELPDFPYETTVETLWNQALLTGNSVSQLAPFKLELRGGRIALRHTLVKANENPNERDIARIEDALASVAPSEARPPYREWFSQQFDSLVWDSERGTFEITDRPAP